MGDSPADVQVLSVRLDLAPVHGLRAQDQTKACARAGADRRGHLPNGRRTGASIMGAPRGQTKTGQLLRREIQSIHDRKILQLAAKVRYELDPTIDYPRHFSGHVKVRMTDGTVLEENQPHPRGGFEDPLPPQEIEAKFRANAGLALPGHKIDEIVQLVDRLEELPAIALLTEKLIP